MNSSPGTAGEKRIRHDRILMFRRSGQELGDCLLFTCWLWASSVFFVWLFALRLFFVFVSALPGVSPELAPNLSRMLMRPPLVCGSGQTRWIVLTVAQILITPISALIVWFTFIDAVIRVDAERVVAQMRVLVGEACRVFVLRERTELRIVTKECIDQEWQTDVFLPWTWGRFVGWHRHPHSPSTVLLIVEGAAYRWVISTRSRIDFPTTQRSYLLL